MYSSIQLHEGQSLETTRDYNYGDRASKEKYLTFIDSHIPTIPTGVFIHLPHVVRLYLNKTGVEAIEHAAFLGLGSLEELHLNDNEIREILSPS